MTRISGGCHCGGMRAITYATAGCQDVDGRVACQAVEPWHAMIANLALGANMCLS